MRFVILFRSFNFAFEFDFIDDTENNKFLRAEAGRWIKGVQEIFIK